MTLQESVNGLGSSIEKDLEGLLDAGRDPLTCAFNPENNHTLSCIRSVPTSVCAFSQQVKGGDFLTALLS